MYEYLNSEYKQHYHSWRFWPFLGRLLGHYILCITAIYLELKGLMFDRYIINAVNSFKKLDK